MVDEKVGSRGKVVAIDLLDMIPVPGALHQGDFSRGRGLAGGDRRHRRQNTKVDLCTFRHGPQFDGVAYTDQANLYELGDLAADFAVKFLKPNGVFLVKVFQGVGFEAYVKDLRSKFKSVSAKEARCLRDESRADIFAGKELKNA